MMVSVYLLLFWQGPTLCSSSQPLPLATVHYRPAPYLSAYREDQHCMENLPAGEVQAGRLMPSPPGNWPRDGPVSCR